MCLGLEAQGCVLPGTYPPIPSFPSLGLGSAGFQPQLHWGSVSPVPTGQGRDRRGSSVLVVLLALGLSLHSWHESCLPHHPTSQLWAWPVPACTLLMQWHCCNGSRSEWWFCFGDATVCRVPEPLSSVPKSFLCFPYESFRLASGTPGLRLQAEEPVYSQPFGREEVLQPLMIFVALFQCPCDGCPGTGCSIPTRAE